MNIKQWALTFALGTAISVAAHGQAVDAARESGRAVSEGTKEGVENAKGHKVRSKIHKAKAHHHRNRAKADAKAATH